MNEILNPAKCIDCGDIYELDGLDLDLRCEPCVKEWAEDCQTCLYAREYCDCEEFLPAE